MEATTDAQSRSDVLKAAGLQREQSARIDAAPQCVAAHLWFSQVIGSMDGESNRQSAKPSWPQHEP
jgi:hypothetical protein